MTSAKIDYTQGPVYPRPSISMDVLVFGVLMHYIIFAIGAAVATLCVLHAMVMAIMRLF